MKNQRTLTFGYFHRPMFGIDNAFSNAFCVITEIDPATDIETLRHELEDATGHTWKPEIIKSFEYNDTPKHRDVFNRLVAIIETRNTNPEVDLIKV